MSTAPPKCKPIPGFESLGLDAGGMSLYLKAGPDGESVGDCPFAQYVRMVLEEKGLEYNVVPAVQSTKPQWLIEFYEGKMPALRHRDECYVESEVIATYLDYFFQEPGLTVKKGAKEAEEAVDGFFPSVAKYLKHTPDGDEVDTELKEGLAASLGRLEAHLTKEGRTGPFLVGDGEKVALQDCALAPKLYHMTVGLKMFKDNALDVAKDFPTVQKYIDTMFARESFAKSTYPEETVAWGWGNARGK